MKKRVLAVFAALMIVCLGAMAAEVTPGEVAVSATVRQEPVRASEVPQQLAQGKAAVSNLGSGSGNVAAVEYTAYRSNTPIKAFSGREYTRHIDFVPQALVDGRYQGTRYRGKATISIPYSLIGGRADYVTVEHNYTDGTAQMFEIFSNDPTVVGAKKIAFLKDGVEFETEEGFSPFYVSTSNAPAAAAASSSVPATGDGSLRLEVLLLALAGSVLALGMLRKKK